MNQKGCKGKCSWPILRHYSMMSGGSEETITNASNDSQPTG